tara:strand:- start:429 stop:1052 length:624 start_codon:yes stop_codon:yes gene_type:complete
MGRILSSLGTSEEIKKLRKENKEGRKAFRNSDKTEDDRLDLITGRAENQKEKQDIRENRRVKRLMARKGLNEDEAKNLRTERVNKRKQFLKDFASYAARGEQAGRAPGEYKGPKTLADMISEEQKDDAKDIKTTVTASAVDNDNSNMDQLLTIGNTSLGDIYKPSRLIGPDAMSVNTDITSLNKGIATEDSTPQSAMTKLYNQKRGF